MEKVLCACGCGESRLRYDKRGRLRKYIHGHFNNGRKTPKEIRDKMSKNMTKFNLTKEFLIEEYVGKEKSSGEIAEEVGCCEDTILLKLEKYGIKRRTKRTKKQELKRILKIKGKQNHKLSETRKRLFKEGKLRPIIEKGQTLEERYGKAKAKSIKKNSSKSHKGCKAWNKDKRCPQLLGENNPNYGNGEKIYGEKNPNWRGGISFEPYGIGFNNKFKRVVRKRDNFTCQECWKTEKELKRKLSVHHIDYNKENNSLYNLISLCNKCHMKTNFDRKHWERYFQMKMFIEEFFNPENLLVFKDKKLIEVIINV